MNCSNGQHWVHNPLTISHVYLFYFLEEIVCSRGTPMCVRCTLDLTGKKSNVCVGMRSSWKRAICILKVGSH